MIQTLMLSVSDSWMSPKPSWAYMATENLWYLGFIISGTYYLLKIMLIPPKIPLPGIIFSSAYLCGFLVKH